MFTLHINGFPFFFICSSVSSFAHLDSSCVSNILILLFTVETNFSAAALTVSPEGSIKSHLIFSAQPSVKMRKKREVTTKRPWHFFVLWLLMQMMCINGYVLGGKLQCRRDYDSYVNMGYSFIALAKIFLRFPCKLFFGLYN